MTCNNEKCSDPRCEGLQQAKSNIQHMVDNDKWSVIGVSGDEIFAYTVGLHHKNLPELIMVGLNPEMAMYILNDCGFMMMNTGRFKHGTVITELANMPTTIINVSEENKQEYAVQAFNHYHHWDFDMMQLVMPDVDGLFPWDQSYSDQMASVQTVLGNPPWSKMN